MKPMNALFCKECEALEREPDGVQDGEECVKCESLDTAAVLIDLCEAEDPRTCNDPFHDHDRGMHIMWGEDDPR
jgi:hypothetical protein